MHYLLTDKESVVRSYEELYYSDLVTNKYTSTDETESWFDYNTGDISYHCIRRSYDTTTYLVCAWIKDKNYKNHWHISRFQTESDDFKKAFNKAKKLCSQKDIVFDGSYDYYRNTSNHYWRHIKFD